MNDSLEARLAALEVMAGTVKPYHELMREFGMQDCCIRAIYAFDGCTDYCLHAVTTAYYWHGFGGPTAETLRTSMADDDEEETFPCPVCNESWSTEPFHPRLASDFDEETERARLMPV